MIKLYQSDIEKFKEVYKDMSSQFPENEMKTFKKFEQLLKTGSYKLFTAQNSSETSVGYCLLYTGSKSKILWLDYIAVFKEQQSKGYGKQIFNAIKETFQEYTGIYLEVEKPDSSQPNTLRRIKFYETLGAKRLPCKYIYPNDKGGLEMDLFFLPIKGQIPNSLQTKSAILEVFNVLHKDVSNLNEILTKLVI